MAIVEELPLFAIRDDVSTQPIGRAEGIINDAPELELLPGINQYLISTGVGVDREGLQRAQEITHLLQGRDGLWRNGWLYWGLLGTSGRLLRALQTPATSRTVSMDMIHRELLRVSMVSHFCYGWGYVSWAAVRPDLALDAQSGGNTRRVNIDCLQSFVRDRSPGL